MEIKVLNNYYTDENTYIVFDEKTKNGLVIDPGYECEGIIKTAQELGVEIKYVLITHCHYDHISSLEPLREKTGCKLISSENGSKNVVNPDINLSLHGLGYEINAKKSDIVLKDNEEMLLDGLNIKCIYTPGHTNCGACYMINDNLFTGDTLFLRSIGRHDLPTGDGNTLINSIKERIYTLPEEITVYPGHGGKSSVGYEKKFNMFVKG